MQQLLRLAIVGAMILGGMSLGEAADDPPLRAIVDKAIKSHGGADKLAKFSASTAKLKGTIHANGAMIPFSGDLATQKGDQQRIDISLNIDGQTLRIVHLLNRDRGWLQIGDTKAEMDAEKLADAKLEAQADWLATLLPLTDKSVTLSAMGEIAIEGPSAIGINASRSGSRDVSLLFDKETYRLVKIQSQARDDETKQLVSEETFLSEYKEVEGTQQAMKIIVKREGKLHAELDVTELKLEEKLDDSAFAAP